MWQMLTRDDFERPVFPREDTSEDSENQLDRTLTKSLLNESEIKAQPQHREEEARQLWG